MKNLSLAVFLTAALALPQSNAQVAPDTKLTSTANDATALAKAADAAKASAEKKTKTAMKGLAIADAANEKQVAEILTSHFMVFKSWHDEHDAQVKALWDEWNQARSNKDGAKPDEEKAAGVAAKIGAVYASFKPEHDGLLARLAPLLSPEQIEMIKDNLTVNKVKVTFNAYQEIFHGLTETQNAFIMKNLKDAREEAMDAAEIKKEGSAFFKTHKVLIEAYLTSQGYDVKKSYAEFVAKEKAAK